MDINSSFTFGGWYYANSNCIQHVSIASKKEIENGYQGWDIGYDNNDNKLRFNVSQDYLGSGGNSFLK